MKTLFALLFLSASLHLNAQIKNSYGLHVAGPSDYREIVKADPQKKLVEIKKVIPEIELDIRYAGKNNFTKQAVYQQARAFARKPVVAALQRVQDDLRKSGLGLKIFDAYRPYSVTVKFFELASDKNFVANPNKGSRHNRGCAVDLTLIDLKTRKELRMPTAYDSFTAAAASDYMDLPADVIKNRSILRKAMEKEGFRVLENEWWHFDFRGWKKFELLDVPFEDL